MKVSKQEFLENFPLITQRIEQYSIGHNKRIAVLAEILICELVSLYPELLSNREAKKIVEFAPLHDIGKLLIPEVILSKNGALTPSEYQIVKTHTTEGAEYLKQTIKFDSEEDMVIADSLARCHHEKYDGSGYPNGLIGDEIPLAARIIALVDVYDGLRSERPYKNSFSHESAKKIILEGDGRTMPTHFDPKILYAFKQTKDKFESEYN